MRFTERALYLIIKCGSSLIVMVLKCWAVISLFIYLLSSVTVVKAVLRRWHWCWLRNGWYCSEFCYRIICIVYWRPRVDLEKVVTSFACGLEEVVPCCNTVMLQRKEQAVCIILSSLLRLSYLFFLWWHAIVIWARKE